MSSHTDGCGVVTRGRLTFLEKESRQNSRCHTSAAISLYDSVPRAPEELFMLPICI